MAKAKDDSGDAVTNFIEEGDTGVSPSYVPPGYETQRAFLDYAIKLYNADTLYDKQNRDWAIDDLKFAAGDQWDDKVKAKRLKLMRPCLTINVLPQFIGQVVGDRRMNKVAIKVRPFRSGTKEIADTRAGLIKSIELYSRAERAYDMACEDQVTCGIGNLRVDMMYTKDDVFEQDIRINHVPNPLSVVWDRMSVDATARDAKHCFVIDNLPKEVFKENYPEAEIPSGGSFGFTDDIMQSSTWVEGEMIRITEFWELIEKPAVFGLLKNGDVVDITEEGSETQHIGNFVIDPATGKAKIRKSKRTYARMHLITSFAILSEPYEIPLTRLPIVRVEGRSIRVGEDRVRFGLVRFAKDSQRLKNYWRSKAAESIALAPQAQWIADKGSVEGVEKEFRENANSGDPLLIHNKGQPKPERVEPPAIPAALVNEANMNQQDIKDTTGLHDASLGIQGNEVSGRAINARQREGDVATVIYHDNLNNSIQEVGDLVNQMIPICYDSLRTERVVGEDDKHRLVTFNDPTNPDAINICSGKYDIVLDTGPNFATQRMEALDAMMALLQTNPDLMQVIGDKVAENMDWPGATEIAARLKKMVPPQLLSDAEQKEEQDKQQNQPPDPQQQQAQAMQQAQLQEAAAQLQHAEQMRQAELAEAQAKAAIAASNAEIAQSKAQQAQAEADMAASKAQQAHVEAAAAPFKADQELTHGQDRHILAVGKEVDQHNQNLQHAQDRHIQDGVQSLNSHLLDDKHSTEAHAADMAQQGQDMSQSADTHQAAQDQEAERLKTLKQQRTIFAARAAQEKAANDPNQPDQNQE